MFAITTTNGLNQTNGYVLSISEFYGDDTDKNIFDFDLNQYDLSGLRLSAYILRDNYLEFDEDRYAELVEESKHERPSDSERLEAQLIYTALMTDTLLPEEEE